VKGWLIIESRNYLLKRQRRLCMICRTSTHGWQSDMLLIFERPRLMQILIGQKMLDWEILCMSIAGAEVLLLGGTRFGLALLGVYSD
jgi:hypothetical protein